MRIKDRKEGIGPPSKAGDELTTEYHAIDETGKVLYTSWDKTPPSEFSFELGADRYPPGLERGLRGMKVGGRRELSIPANLTDGLGPLFYVIDLLEINRDGHCWAAQSLRRAGPTRRAEIRNACQSRVRIL